MDRQTQKYNKTRVHSLILRRGHFSFFVLKSREGTGKGADNKIAWAEHLCSMFKSPAKRLARLLLSISESNRNSNLLPINSCYKRYVEYQIQIRTHVHKIKIHPEYIIIFYDAKISEKNFPNSRWLVIQVSKETDSETLKSENRRFTEDCSQEHLCGPREKLNSIDQ